MIDGDRLKSKAKQYGIELNQDVLQKLVQYTELIESWNSKFNLTAIREPEEVEDKHLLDSLILAMQPEVKGTLADVGTGAGLPGVIVEIYNNNTHVTLIEANRKKTAFLSAVSKELGLEYLVINGRAEELGRNEYREKYDIVTARAVASMPVLSEYCMPLVKPGGFFIAMKGRQGSEAEDARNAVHTLGGDLLEERPYELPDGSQRVLYVVKKNAPTESKYPRHAAKIKKQPL